MTNPRGVPIPPRPRLDRRDSGVTAAVWGKEKYLATHGASLSPAAQAGPEGLGCNRRCVGEGKIPDEPTGRPYPPAA